ncbi:MAG: SelB C-terminal domain-containing protein, partial [Pseudomonadota bacterium]
EFNAAAIVACSSHTMDGIDLLKKGLRGLLTLSRSRSSPEHAFLPVDRVFSADGSGTVVTGTLLGGDLNAEDPIIIQPAETAGSVRGLQIAGKSVENGAPGARVAVNIRGIKAQGIKKGDVICPPHQGKPSRVFDVAIVPPVIGARPLSHMEEITVLHGTRHSPARVRLLNVSDQGPIIGQLEFKSDQIGFAGQHFVMRRPASAETVCGGQILDAEATVAKRRKDLHTAVLVATTQRDVLEIAKALSERDDGSVDLSQLSRLARKSIASCSALLGAEYVLGENDVAYAVAQFEALKIQIVKSTSAFHLERPTRPQAPAPSANATFNRNPRALLLHAIQGLIDEKTIETRLDGISIAGRDPNEYLSAAQRESYQGAIEQLRRTGLMPELPLDPNSSAPEHADLIELMVWNGDAVRLYNHALNQTIILHSHAILDAIDRLRDAFPAEQTFKTGEAREVLSTNRKTIVPLLEHLDTRGATRRIGNVRFIEEGILE